MYYFLVGPNCSTKQCLLPGCKQFRFIDTQTNNEMLFCGKNHKTNAENLGELAAQSMFDKSYIVFLFLSQYY